MTPELTEAIAALEDIESLIARAEIARQRRTDLLRGLRAAGVPMTELLNIVNRARQREGAVLLGYHAIVAAIKRAS